MDLGFNEPTEPQRNIMQQTIETTEFFLAVWLLSHQVNLVGHIRSDKRSTFTFSGESVNKLIQEFYSDDAVINVKRFTSSIRQLKSLMYGGTIIQPTTQNERNITTTTI